MDSVCVANDNLETPFYTLVLSLEGPSFQRAGLISHDC